MRTLRLEQPNPYRLLYALVEYLPLSKQLSRPEKDRWLKAIVSSFELLVETVPEFTTEEFVMWGYHRFPIEEVA